MFAKLCSLLTDLLYMIVLSIWKDDSMPCILYLFNLKELAVVAGNKPYHMYAYNLVGRKWFDTHFFELKNCTIGRHKLRKCVFEISLYVVSECLKNQTVKISDSNPVHLLNLLMWVRLQPSCDSTIWLSTWNPVTNWNCLWWQQIS